MQPNDDIPLTDQVNIELDRRKLEKLINAGKISREELAKAPIVHVDSPDYEFDKPGNVHDIIGVQCGMCSFSCKTMKQYEQHLIQEHINAGR